VRVLLEPGDLRFLAGMTCGVALALAVGVAQVGPGRLRDLRGTLARA
jgi:hypothetical protein